MRRRALNDDWNTADVYEGGKLVAVAFDNKDGTYCIYVLTDDYTRWQHIDALTAECVLIELTRSRAGVG